MLLRTRRQRRLLAPVLTLVVGLGLAVLPATGAQAEPTEATALTIKLTRAGVELTEAKGNLFGVFYDGIGPATPYDTFTVTGTLKSGSTPLADKTVRLFRQAKTATGAPQEIATGKTNAKGVYSFPQKVVRGAGYGVQFDGDDTYVWSYTGPDLKLLPAMRDLNAGKRKVNGKLYFRGTVRPLWNNRLVTLQKKACGTCGWKTVTSKRTSAKGAWSFRVSYPSKVGPVWRWQVVLRQAGDFERSFSTVLTTRRVYGRMAAARLG